MDLQLWEMRGVQKKRREGKGEMYVKDREKESLFLNILLSILLVSSWVTENQLEQELPRQMAQHNC